MHLKALSAVQGPSATPLPSPRSRLGLVLSALLLAGPLACQPANEARPSNSASKPTPSQKAGNKAALSPSALKSWLQDYVESANQQNPAPTLSETVASQQWRVSFADAIAPGISLDIDVALHEEMTVIMAPLLTLPAHTTRDLLIELLIQNYQMFQAKFALNEAGLLYLGFEVPNRLLDEQELRDNLDSLRLSAGKSAKQITQALVAAQGEQAGQAGLAE